MTERERLLIEQNERLREIANDLATIMHEILDALPPEVKRLPNVQKATELTRTIIRHMRGRDEQAHG